MKERLKNPAYSKRVLIFAAFYYPHIGGYEKNIHELAKRLVKRGIEVDVITSCTNNEKAEIEIDGVKVYRIPCWYLMGGTYPIPKPSLKILYIFKKIFAKRYSVVNTQTRFFLFSLLGAIFAKIRGIELIHTERGASHSILENSVSSFISRVFDHVFGSFIVKASNKLVAVSSATHQFLLHLGGKNKKIAIIPNGIDLNPFSQDESDFRKEANIGENTILITFVGRLVFGKGVQDLIEAVSKISVDEKVVLCIVGDGPYKKTLVKLSKEINGRNTRKKIIFLGEKKYPDVIKILKSSDIFVNPSYSEGFGVVLLEASAAKNAIIATKVGGVLDIIKDGYNGLLIPPGKPDLIREKIELLINNREFAMRLRNNAFSFVRKFDWEKIVDKWINFCIGETYE